MIKMFVALCGAGLCVVACSSQAPGTSHTDTTSRPVTPSSSRPATSVVPTADSGYLSVVQALVTNQTPATLVRDGKAVCHSLLASGGRYASGAKVLAPLHLTADQAYGVVGASTTYYCPQARSALVTGPHDPITQSTVATNAYSPSP